MIKQFFKILFIMLLPLALICSVAIAQEGDDSQSEDRPPGWDKGKKEGWQSDVPPGQEEKEKTQKRVFGDDDASDGDELKKEKIEKKEKNTERDKKKKKRKKAKKSKK